MKKITALFIAAVLLAGCLSVSVYGEAADSKDGKIQIVTTIFPEYDWVMNVLGDNPACADVTMLLDKGVDLHSYQPSAADILKISTCDLFIYVGGESDDWVEDALQEAVNDEMVVINLLAALGDSVRAEEVVEGMQADEHDHDHDHEHEDEEHPEDEEHEHEEHEDHHEHEDVEYDEHVWLSLRYAATLVDSISAALQTIDPDNSDIYLGNAASYIEKLNSLDSDYQAAVSSASGNTLLVADRFPFRYLVDDYGLSYYAAFPGCSAETEASFETVMFLTRKLNELSLHTVLVTESSDQKIAETIIRSADAGGQQILVLDSMQSVTGKDVQNGVTYLSVMESNLSVLKDALK